MQNKPRLVRITPIFSTVKAIYEHQNRFFVDNGFEVHVVTSADPSADVYAKTEGFHHHTVNISRSFSINSDIKTIFKLTSILRKIRPDIVHTHTSKGGFVGMTASSLAGVKHRIHSIAGWTADFRGPFAQEALLLAEKVTLNLATEIIVNSKSLMDYLFISGHLNFQRAHVLGCGSSNGVDLDRFSRKEPLISHGKSLRKKFGIPEENIVIAFVGRIMAEKGILDLIEAFEALNNSHTNLLLIGSLELESRGKLPDGILRAIRNHPRISISGWTDDVPGFLSAADILVHPSYHEGLPNAILQASAMQLPCIASRVRGNIDAVKDGETGILFETGNVKQLTDCLLKLIHDESLRRRMGSKGRNFVEQEFDSRKVCDLLLAFYRSSYDKGNIK